jgi:hypothetical protein
VCPSTESTDARREFAADVLRGLLRYIAEQNTEGRYTHLVSHAWIDGPRMHLVYTAPPSDITWGLVRDTRVSTIDPGPWPSVNEAVLYYYLLDLEGIQPSAATQHPSEPGSILWLGDRYEGLPERPSDIPEAYRYKPPPGRPTPQRREDREQPVVNEPRRYADPP